MDWNAIRKPGDSGELAANVQTPNGVVGMNDAGLNRLLLAFDLSGLPAGAAIEKATLRLHLVAKHNDPQGSVLVEHAPALSLDRNSGGHELAQAFEADGFVAVSGGLVNAANAPKVNQWYELDVTEAVRADRSSDAGVPMTHLRLSMSPEPTSQVRWVFATQERPAGPQGESLAPQLVIQAAPDPQ